jgi:hypothetical protein
MKIILTFALALFILTNVCSATSLQKESKYAVAGIDDAEAVDKFFLELKKAVEKDERDKVILLVDYPINVLIKGRRTRLRNKAELLKNYDSIFNKNVKQALAKASAPSFVNYQGVMIGDGEIWFNLIKDKLKITAINN